MIGFFFADAVHKAVAESIERNPSAWTGDDFYLVHNPSKRCVWIASGQNCLAIGSNRDHSSSVWLIPHAGQRLVWKSVKKFRAAMVRRELGLDQ